MFRNGYGRCVAILVWAWCASLSWSDRAQATDYFLTIGGGYNRTGNQASLEANVVFFQQVLRDRHQGPRRHVIYFADGHDPAADLQVLAEKPAKNELPATEVIASLHRRRGQEHVTYRNHRVDEIAGALDPALIRGQFESLAKTVQTGDRLIVYVTAHGSAGPQDDPFNTTIDCWNERKITAREFTELLNLFPREVPVVMVMAQCYCGGFGHTIFQGLDETRGLAPQLRAGFFAQQHNLPAAGCRPDIEHDEEFSSYFWGALAGRSRNGVPIADCDVDGNGVISFAEAYAYAVVAGETIDIPLRTSEVFLRKYSRSGPAGESPSVAETETPRPANPASGDDAEGEDKPREAPAQTKAATVVLTGTLQDYVDRSRPVSGRIVKKLSETLGFKLQDDVSTVVSAADELRRAGRGAGRGRPGFGGGRRGGGGRREFLRQITEKWPELGDPRRWEESALLKPENQQTLLAELQQLPGWKAFDERRQQMEAAGNQSSQQELRGVKFRRLLNTLEAIQLERDLPGCASAEIVERYRQLLTLEESAFTSGESR
ncbi:MAG: hypothetical protein JSS02_18225 [Planctomycetes bacterium]|nr:hypothetical protein [Planctomycetota bacterium]